MRRILCILVTTLISIWLVGCNANVQRPEPEGQTDVNHIARPIVVANSISPLDEQYFPLTLPSHNDYRYRLEHLIFDGILKINENHTFSDNLGSIQFSNNYKKATISLQERNWHDGTKVTAEDVLFTYSLLLDRDRSGQFNSLLLHIAGATEYYSKVSDSISGITLIDNQKLEFTFNHAVADNLLIFTYPILPKHIYQNLSNDQLKDKFRQTLIGSSPYQVIGIQPNEIHVKFNEKFANGTTANNQGVLKHIYEDILKNTPEGMIFRTYSSDDLRMAMEQEEFDILYTHRQAITKLLNDNSNYQVQCKPGNMFFYLGFNLKTGETNTESRKQIQQILSNAVSEQAFDEYWQPIHSLHRDSSVWYQRPANHRIAAENVNSNGTKLSLLFLDKPESKDMAQQIKEILSKQNIDINLRGATFEEYLNQLYVVRDFDLFIGTSVFSVLPVQNHWWSKQQLVENNGFNQTGFISRFDQEIQQRNVEFISLAYQKEGEINRMETMSGDANYQLYQQLLEEIDQVVPLVLLASPNDVWLIHERVKIKFDKK